MFAVFDNVISKEHCQILKSRIESWYYHCLTEDSKDNIWQWNKRVLDVTPMHLNLNHTSAYERNFNLDTETKKIQEDVCEKVINFLKTRLNVEFDLQRAELQTWPMNTNGPMHSHNQGGANDTDYNSLLYLNDDFNGGEFLTENGLIVRPTSGRLTFFDGFNIKHGVGDIYDGNRYTMIFWWKNTKFK